MTAETFADLLVRHGIVEPDAVNHPEGFDGGLTLASIRSAYKEICEGLQRATVPLGAVPDDNDIEPGKG